MILTALARRPLLSPPVESILHHTNAYVHPNVFTFTTHSLLSTNCVSAISPMHPCVKRFDLRNLSFKTVYFPIYWYEFISKHCKEIRIKKLTKVYAHICMRVVTPLFDLIMPLSSTAFCNHAHAAKHVQIFLILLGMFLPGCFIKVCWPYVTDKRRSSF